MVLFIAFLLRNVSLGSLICWYNTFNSPDGLLFTAADDLNLPQQQQHNFLLLPARLHCIPVTFWDQAFSGMTVHCSTQYLRHYLQVPQCFWELRKDFKCTMVSKGQDRLNWERMAGREVMVFTLSRYWKNGTLFIPDVGYALKTDIRGRMDKFNHFATLLHF